MIYMQGCPPSQHCAIPMVSLSETRSECDWDCHVGGPPGKCTSSSSRLQNRQSAPQETCQTYCTNALLYCTPSLLRSLRIIHLQGARVKEYAKHFEKYNFYIPRTPHELAVLLHFLNI